MAKIDLDQLNREADLPGLVGRLFPATGCTSGKATTCRAVWRGDTNPSFSIRKVGDSWLWNDFGKTEDGSGNAYQFLTKIAGLCHEDAIRELTGKPYPDLPSKTRHKATPKPVSDSKPQPQAAPSKPVDLPAILRDTQQKLAASEPFPEQLIQRGLNLEGAQKIGLGIDSSDNLFIPVYDPDGQLVNIKKRPAKGNARYYYLQKGAGSPAWYSPGFAAAQRYLIVEGELNAALCWLALGSDWGVVGLPGAQGHLNWDALKTSVEPIYIYTDPDEPGRGALTRLASAALPRVIWSLAPLEDDLDACDYAGTHGQPALAQRLQQLMEAAQPLEANPIEPDVHEADDTDEVEPPVSGKKSAMELAHQIIEEDGVEFWRDQDLNCYVTFPHKGHVEHHRIESSAFWTLLAYQVHERSGKFLSKGNCGDLESIHQGKALYKGAQYPVAQRAHHEDQRVYIDLGDDSHQLIQVAGGSWSLIPSQASPARFLRNRAQRALSMPVMPDSTQIRESLAMLRSFLNVSDSGFVLMVSWLIAALSGRGPFPILVLNGSQGSGKSTTSALLRLLVDPRSTPSLAPPKDDEDLLIAALNSYLLVYDNMSSISSNLSDALCRVSTGAGWSNRKKYTDNEEVTFHIKRPMIINGIPDLLGRSDLAERSLAVTLERITEEDRRMEQTLWEEFAAYAPIIQGALLSALAHGLHNLKSVQAARLPRMADFARLILACEPLLPWEPGEFMAAYQDGQKSSYDSILEDCPIVQPLRAELNDSGGYLDLSTSELYSRLLSRAGLEESGKRLPRGWPGQSQGLTRLLRRMETPLAQIKVICKWYRKDTASHWKISLDK